MCNVHRLRKKLGPACNLMYVNTRNVGYIYVCAYVRRARDLFMHMLMVQCRGSRYQTDLNLPGRNDVRCTSTDWHVEIDTNHSATNFRSSRFIDRPIAMAKMLAEHMASSGCTR
jgi:hypothetical protein